MEKSNNFAFRFKDSEQKKKATDKAKSQNRSLNGYLSTLVDRDLQNRTVNYEDLASVLKVQGVLLKRRSRV